VEYNDFSFGLFIWFCPSNISNGTKSAAKDKRGFLRSAWPQGRTRKIACQLITSHIPVRFGRGIGSRFVLSACEYRPVKRQTVCFACLADSACLLPEQYDENWMSPAYRSRHVLWLYVTTATEGVTTVAGRPTTSREGPTTTEELPAIRPQDSTTGKTNGSPSAKLHRQCLPETRPSG
jgi:hypothetical protein